MWSRSFTAVPSDAQTSSATPVNALVREALIEGRTSEKYEKDGYAVKWTFVNELELIFVVSKWSDIINGASSTVSRRWRIKGFFS